MDHSKRKTTRRRRQEAHPMLSRSYASKEEFLRDYKNFCGETSKDKEFYLLLLRELEEAVSQGEIAKLKKINNLIVYINNVVDHESLRNYYDNICNPIRNTNLIILACKHNKIKILDYLFDGVSTVLNNLSGGIGKTTISPEDKDEANHNAFYYATRLESKEVLEILINKWPDNYFAVHLEELEDIMAKAYQELKLKNVLLSEEMEVFVQRKLIDLRFFSRGQDLSANKIDLNIKTEQRIKLLLESINMLTENYANSKKVDGKFLYIARFIAKNIHILKGRLRSYYDSIPWEEMEFCLVIFIYSHTRIEELNLFYLLILNKKNILIHLKNFANKLKKEGENLHRLPRRGPTRKQIVEKIIKNDPQFEELYNDYHKIRDIYSLKRINEHIKLALLADAQDKQEQLVIIRTLQVIGENFKSTLESPKLSHATSEILVQLLSPTARKIIIALRDAISHPETLALLIEIEKNERVSFFVNIQDDIKKVGDVITDILYKNRIKTIRLLLEKVVESETLDEIKEVDLNTAKLDITILENFKPMQHEKLKEHVTELSDNIVNKTNYVNELFDQINSIISQNLTENDRGNYLMGYTYLRSFNSLMNGNNCTNTNLIKLFKDAAIQTLKDLTVTMQANEFEEIVPLLIKICQSVELRMENNEFIKVKLLVLKIISIIKFETTDFEEIEELNEKFPKRNQKKTKLCKDKVILTLKPEDNYNKDLKLKLHELKAIINNNSLDGFKSDNKLQTMVRMLVLDIMVILGFSVDYLENNHLFLDDNTPLLHGKCLRNYLAHDNVLIDVLFSDPLIALILNAEKLANEENIIASKKRIGKLVNDDPAKLRKKFEEDLKIITNQERMFAALEKGDLVKVKHCIQKGADIKARSAINSWTTLHFAAKGPSLEVVTFVLGQNLSVNVKDNNGETPLHVAAAYGRQDIVVFFIKETDTRVDVLNINDKTPLHFAAENGHMGIVEDLLKCKADILSTDSFGKSPLLNAVTNNHIDVVKIFLSGDLNVDILSDILREAAVYGHLELVNILMKNGADVNALSDLNEAPLHLAVTCNHLEVVNSLIRQGANVNLRAMDFSEMPLHLAVRRGNVEMVNTLLTYGAHVNTGATSTTATPLHLAANIGSIKIVAVLLIHGADINAEFNNHTPLYCAALSGHKKVVEFLMQCGAQIGPTENNKLTALHAAVGNNHQDVADLLIKNKASVNAKTIEGFTAMHIAAHKDIKEIIDLLIRNKGDVNARSCDGRTPLHAAVSEGKLAAINFLIKNKANVNERDDDGLTPFYLAVLKNYKDIVNLLIENNAQVNFEDTGDSIPQPLNAAVHAGHKEMVEILIAKGANINNKFYSNTPLFYAIKKNHKEIVELLIEKGANVDAKDLELSLINGLPDVVETLIKSKSFDVNHKDSGHYTPLHKAAFMDHKKIVKVLIKNGADVHAVSVYTETPLFFAARNGFEEVVEILIEHGSQVNLKNNQNLTPLCVAAESGHSKVVKLLLDNKVNVDINDTTNKAPVRLAVAHGHLQVVKMLLEYTKPNINAKDENGRTLLHIASEGTNLELVKYLVDQGSDINATTLHGYKAIHTAAHSGFKECVEFFIGKGLSVNELSANNTTILHCAAMEGHLEVVNYLIKNHADVNAKNTTGKTPIDCAATGGYKEVIELLKSTDKLFKAVKKNSSLEVQHSITAGAFVNARNTESNITPLHHAAWKGYDEVAQVLLQNKANPNAVNWKGITPLHYAAKFSHLNVVKVLLSHYAVYNAISHDGKTPSDFTRDKSIISLFKLVTESFKHIEDRNPRVIDNLESLEDVDTVKAIMCASNTENKTLVIAAIHSNFPKVQQLKEIRQGDISAQINKAVELVELENYQEALRMFKDAFKERKEILGPDNPGTLDIQKYIGKVLLKKGDHQEALNLFKEILQKQEEMLGSYHRDTLNTKNLIASVMNGQGRNEEALSILQEIYQKQMDLLGSHDEDTLNTQWKMGKILSEQGKHQKALDIFKSVYKNTKSDDLTKELTARYNIAAAHAKQGNSEQAMDIYKEILEKAKVHLPLNHPFTLSILANIGKTLSNQRKYNKALAVLRKVLIKQEKVLKPNHPEILNTQMTIGKVFDNQRKWISALKEYSKGFDQMKAALGSNNPEVLDIVKRTKRIDLVLKLKGMPRSHYIQYLQKIINIPAISTDDIQMVEDVADSNDQDQFRQTPLHYAISNGHINAVSILLNNGADVNLVSNEGHTPLYTAIFNGYKEIGEMLLQHVQPDKLNHFINAKTTDSGATSLHLAAMRGYFDIVMSLLKLGAIYNITNNEGKSPLHLCQDLNIINMLKLVEEFFQYAENGNVEIIQKLEVVNPEEFVAITNARNNQNYSLLEVVIVNQHKNVVTKLSEMINDLSRNGCK